MGVPINAHANQIESFSESDEDRYIVTLSFDELKKIEGLKIENRSLNNARNWILIGCAFGQRGNDGFQELVKVHSQFFLSIRR